MSAPIAGNLEVQAREDLDAKYRVQSVSNLDDGLIFDGLRRFVKDNQKNYTRRNGIWTDDKGVAVDLSNYAKLDSSNTFTKRQVVSDSATNNFSQLDADRISFINDQGLSNITSGDNKISINTTHFEVPSPLNAPDAVNKGYLDQQLSIIQPLFIPIKSNEVNTAGQGIVSLNLRDAIIWLANNRCCEGTTTPTETIQILDVQGDDAITMNSATAS